MNCPKCNKNNRSEAVYCKWCGNSMISKSNTSLQELVGMEEVKEQLQELVKTCEKLSLRAKNTGVKMRIGMNMVITGNTGTGKTKLVEVLQKLLYANGIIKKPVVKIVDAVDYEAFSADEETWEENIADAKGGILLIENAQKLVPTDLADDIFALDKLFKCMNDEWNNDPIVILSGLFGLKLFMASNPDISNRFEYHFDLKDLSVEGLTEVCSRKLQRDYQLNLNEEAREKLFRIFTNEFRNKKADFGNGHLADKKANDILSNVINRDHNADIVLAEDVKGTEFKPKSYDEIMADLDEFVGIDEIKETIQKIISKIDFEQERKGADAKREIKDHFVFIGNPGTGKTTIARVFADIFNSINVLPTGQLVEVKRKDLVAEYVGQTGPLVESVVEKAMGGLLFIDEAYMLKQDENDSFGQEAIDTLLTSLENSRGKFVAIVAGYTKEMNDFLGTNPGLASRFNETVNFRDYKVEELTEIFRRLVKKEKMTLDAAAAANIEGFFKKMYISRNVNSFGNARAVRNAFEDAMKKQALRLQKLRGTADYTSEMLSILTRADIEGEESLKEKDLDAILAELDEFIGMDSVKKEIRELANNLEFNRRKMERGIGDAKLINLHIILTGNPGTGKTTVASKLGEIFKAIGLLPTSKVVTKEAKNILSSYVNDTAKSMDKACDEAMGGILLIDEAYMLAKIDGTGNVDQTGADAVAALMTRMVNDAGKFVVIVAGYRKEMEEFVKKANPGFERRFTTKLHIEDYTADQLTDIFLLNVKKAKNTITDKAKELLRKMVTQMVDAKSENFGNAGEIVKLFEQTDRRRSNRLMAMERKGETITDEMYSIIEASDIPYEEPKEINEEECFTELNQLIGLNNVKQTLKEIADYIKVERVKAELLGKKFEGVSDHYLFVGNPGTGKTTVARIMGNIFFSLGVLPTNKLIEVTREDLVVGYVGQTAPKTKRVVKSAIGGVLFIDEAYSLKSGGDQDFGQEATDTILPMMLDYKGKMVFIAAGYPREIQQWINTNSGLESRFTKTIYFEDYTGEEMADIFRMKAEKDQLTLTPEAEETMLDYFKELYENRSRNFANAREVNNYFNKVKKNQSSRLRKAMEEANFDKKELTVLTLEDMRV